MTLREWAIAYDLAYGRENVRRNNGTEEEAFLRMIGEDIDCDDEGEIVWLLAVEFRRIDHEKRQRALGTESP